MKSVPVVSGVHGRWVHCIPVANVLSNVVEWRVWIVEFGLSEWFWKIQKRSKLIFQTKRYVFVFHKITRGIQPFLFDPL